MSVIRTEKLTKFYGHARGVVDLDFASMAARCSASSAQTAPARRRRSD